MGLLTRLRDFFRWAPASNTLLQEAEEELLRELQTPIVHRRIPCGEGVELNTVETLSEGPPLVLMHGWGAGIGFWIRNIDDLASHFKVYAVDWLGFGGSSRPTFRGRTTEDAEDWWVDSLEEWRAHAGIEKMVLVGHSLGGYLCANYALRYPDRVIKLILVSPVGVPAAPPMDGDKSHADEDMESSSRGQATEGSGNADESGKSQQPIQRRRFPWWALLLAKVIWKATPQTMLRLLGPLGPRLMQGYAERRFLRKVPAGFANYIYQINAHPQTSSGGRATKYILGMWAYALKPLWNRMDSLEVPVSLVYGDRDWMDADAGRRLVHRLNSLHPEMEGSFADMEILEKAGHHLYLDNDEDFADFILRSTEGVPGRVGDLSGGGSPRHEVLEQHPHLPEDLEEELEEAVLPD